MVTIERQETNMSPMIAPVYNIEFPGCVRGRGTQAGSSGLLKLKKTAENPRRSSGKVLRGMREERTARVRALEICRGPP